jgi:hypothetical protein
VGNEVKKLGTLEGNDVDDDVDVDPTTHLLLCRKDPKGHLMTGLLWAKIVFQIEPPVDFNLWKVTCGLPPEEEPRLVVVAPPIAVAEGPNTEGSTAAWTARQ